MSKIYEKLMTALFFIAACTSIVAVALICFFLFANGIPAMGKNPLAICPPPLGFCP